MRPAQDGEGLGAGTVIAGKYRIESLLGKGGMGLVYRAFHLALAEDVAIKVLRRDVSLDEETVARFTREAQSAVRLKSEHVARIKDVETFEDGLPYMVMEFLQGADLGQMVETHGAMAASVACDLVIQACDAIAEAHALGIVHRDVKPSNLFVSFRPDQSPLVKVLDFGISKSANGSDLSLTQTQSMLGTPAYMSPEQMRSARSVDARTDIWSLGTVLYELVEACRPFEAESFSEMCVMVAVDPPRKMVRAPELEPVILRCLAKAPADRYANVAELMRDLARFAANQDAAPRYVMRAHRMLGLPVPSQRDSTPYPRYTPLPSHAQGPTPALVRDAASAAMTSPTQLPTATVQDPPRVTRSSRGLVIGMLAFIALGVGVGVVIARTTGDDAPAPPPPDPSAHAVQMPAPAAVPPDAPDAISATVTPDAAVPDAPEAPAVADAAIADAKPPPRPARPTAKPPVAKPPVAKPEPAKPEPPKPPPAPPKPAFDPFAAPRPTR